MSTSFGTDPMAPGTRGSHANRWLVAAASLALTLTIVAAAASLRTGREGLAAQGSGAPGLADASARPTSSFLPGSARATAEPAVREGGGGAVLAWRQVDGPPVARPYRLASDGTTFYAVGSTAVATSEDGEHWTTSTPDGLERWPVEQARNSSRANTHVGSKIWASDRQIAAITISYGMATILRIDLATNTATSIVVPQDDSGAGYVTGSVAIDGVGATLVIVETVNGASAFRLVGSTVEPLPLTPSQRAASALGAIELGGQLGVLSMEAIWALGPDGTWRDHVVWRHHAAGPELEAADPELLAIAPASDFVYADGRIGYFWHPVILPAGPLARVTFEGGQDLPQDLPGPQAVGSRHSLVAASDVLLVSIFNGGGRLAVECSVDGVSWSRRTAPFPSVGDVVAAGPIVLVSGVDDGRVWIGTPTAGASPA